MIENSTVDHDEWHWVQKLWELEVQDKKRSSNNSNATTLNIRVRPETKEKFKNMFYSLKADGIISTQEELIKGLIKIFETRRRLLIKVLNREFR